MPDQPSEPQEPLDVRVRTVRQLVRLMTRYDLSAIDVMEGSTKIRLRRRGPDPVPGSPSPAGGYFVAAPQPAQPAASAANPAPTSVAAPPSNEVVIESPMVGTYFSSPAPDAPPFIGVGSHVRPDTTVAVIEAMKVFTDIPAGVSGTVTEVLVKNGLAVDFGQPMFRVRTA